MNAGPEQTDKLLLQIDRLRAAVAAQDAIERQNVHCRLLPGNDK